MGIEQRWLPSLDGIPVVSKDPKQRQPRLDRSRSLSPTELLTHPLDLNFRGRLHHWLEDTQEQGDFTLEEVLSEHHLRITRLYLFPQPPDGRWFNQSQVMAQVSGDPKTTLFREILLGAIVRIWRRNVMGPRAVEILKLPNFLYRSLIERELTTINEVRDADPDKIRLACGARPMFETLKERLQEHFPEWNPDIIFRQEMLPQEAFARFHQEG